MDEEDLMMKGPSDQILGLWSPSSVPSSVKSTELYKKEKKMALDSITVWTVPEEVKNHIVIVGSHKGLTHLFATFRRSDVHKHQLIVILTKKQPRIVSLIHFVQAL